MTDLFVFPDIAGNEINLSSSENYKSHALAEHSCVDAIVSQFNNEFYYYLKEQEELNLIDLGANIGLFSLFVSPVCEKVFSVEPTPSHFELLKEVVKLSGKTNIEPHQLAIGTSDGECAEGSVWEALRFAYENKVTNLKLYVNANGWSAYDTVDLDYLEKRIKAFHPDVNYVRTTVEHFGLKGLHAHYTNFNEEQYKEALASL